MRQRRIRAILIGARQKLATGATQAKGGDQTEILAYNLTRVMNIVGSKPLMAAIVA